MIKLLVLIVVILALLTIWRIIRVLELVRDLRGEEEYVTDADSKRNGIYFILFLVVGLIGMVYFTLDAKKYLLPVAASKHGVLTDDYLNLNFALIIVVFFITQILLFGFAYKYRHRKGEKAYFYPDNHKLELIWTAVPGVVLMGLIVYGLKLWTDITGPAPKDAMVIEIYGKQFDWTARYAEKIMYWVALTLNSSRTIILWAWMSTIRLPRMTKLPVTFTFRLIHRFC